jgi:hypothetical protein
VAGYRDEKAALEARVGGLERDLADAQETIAALKGQRGAVREGTGREVRRSRLLGGAPVHVELSHELPHEITEAGYEAIARVLRERLQLPVSQVGRTLRSDNGAFVMSYEDGTTTVRLVGNWATNPFAAPAGATVVGGFAAMMAAGVLHDVAHVTPAHALWIAPLVALPLGALIFSRVRKGSIRRLETFDGVFATILALAEEHAVEPERVRARVDAATDHETVEARAPAGEDTESAEVD